MKKIAFFDIDGTMINVPNNIIHPTSETMRVLNEFKQQKNYIVVATARGSVPSSIQDIDFDGYIFNDGHYIIFNNQVWIDDIFTKDEIAKQMAAYKKYDGKSMFGGHELSWCACPDDPMVTNHREMFSGTSARPANLIEKFEIEDVEAISCCVLFKTIEQLQACYDELKEDFTIVPYYTGLIRMDVYKKGFTKGTACKYMFEKLGIPKKTVMLLVMVSMIKKCFSLLVMVLQWAMPLMKLKQLVMILLIVLITMVLPKHFINILKSSQKHLLFNIRGVL